MVTKLRLITQHIMFIVLTYGGRFNIQLGSSLPCFSCPYVSGCGGACYLMALQGNWSGLQMSWANLTSAMGLDLLSHLGIFVLLVILLNKFWCGWICPFGLFQDWLTYLRRGLGLREAQFTWLTRDRLKPIKWILLGYLLIVPLLIAHASQHYDLHLPFCRSICPAKPLMPLFIGNIRHLSLDFTNTVTLVFSIFQSPSPGGCWWACSLKNAFSAFSVPCWY
nr:4Fe-4S binding protein [Desulfobacula sp.]